MQVNVEQLDPCKTELTIEVDTEKVAETIEEVYKEFSKYTSVPGFRKGKTPRNILERYVKPESVRREAIEHLVPPAYMEAIKEKDIHPYADPNVDVVQFEEDKPFIFKAVVPLPPVVELGEYKGIEVERPAVKVTKEDVENQLKYLQESRATSTKVEDRGVKKGDVVIADIASAVQGEDKGEPRRSLVEVGSNVADFDDNIIGLKPGERKNFTVEYPKDFSDENLAGKKVDFDLSVEAIRERHLPELNDEFAKAVDSSYESLAAMKEDIKKRLTEARETEADNEAENKIVDEIIARSKVCIPDILVEHEMGHDIEDIQARLSRQGATIEQYLQQAGKTQEEFLAELREIAAKRVRTGLALAEISDAEKLDVTDEDLNAEIDRMAEESKATRESVEAYIDTRGGRDALRNTMLNKKIADYIKSVSKIKQKK